MRLDKDSIKDHIKRCLDNTATIDKYEDLGILYFARTFLDPCKGFRQSKIHYHITHNILELFSPEKIRRTQRQCYVKVFREAAKSTHCSYVLPLFLCNMVGYNMYLRENAEGYDGADIHDYKIHEIPIVPENILLMSETHAAAERFTSNIRVELETNAELRAVFGNKTPRGAIDEYTGQWRRDMFQTSDGTLVGGQGAGQQVRGFLVGGARITLAIFDDIYSRKNTLTAETREKLRYWFFAEAINSTDSVRGKVALLGTMVHEDTVFHDIAKSEQWKGFTYPAIGEDDLQKAISSCTFDYEERVMKLPDPKVAKRIENECTTLAWKERQSLMYLLEIYKEKWEQHKVSYFYQEQLNILSAPDDERFSDSKFLITDINYSKQYGKIWAEFTYNSYRWKGVIETTIGIDIASSEREASDYTAILVGGWCKAYPQLEGYDYQSGINTHPHKKNGLYIPILIDGYVGKTDIYEDTDRGKVGIANIAYKFASQYNVKQIVCEINGQQGAIAREVKKYIQSKGHQTMFQEILTTLKKEDSIISTLGPVIQGSKITVLQNIKLSGTLWSQLKHLGVTTHDDLADAFKNIFMFARKPNAPDYQSGINEVSYRQDTKIEIPSWEVV